MINYQAASEYYAFGKPDWLPVGLLLMRYDHGFLKDILAAMMGRHNLPPDDWFDALKRQGDQLLYNRGQLTDKSAGQASAVQPVELESMTQAERLALQMKKSEEVGGKRYSPIVEEYEFEQVIDYYDGPLSGSVRVGMHSYFYFLVDTDDHGHAIYRVVKTTRAELR